MNPVRFHNKYGMTAACVFFPAGGRCIKFYWLIPGKKSGLDGFLFSGSFSDHLRRRTSIDIFIDDHIGHSAEIKLRGRICIKNNGYASVGPGNNAVIRKNRTIYF